MKENRTRTSGTNSNYIDRAKNLIKRFRSNTGFDIKTHESEFIEWLIQVTTNKSNSNWRQLKASCVYYFGQIGKESLAKNIEDLDSSHTINVSIFNNTSSQKKKSVSQVEKEKINAYLTASISSDNPSHWDKATFTLFNAMLNVGLRPSEWEHASLIETTSDETPLHPPILKVLNGKATNGRSFGEYRYIGLEKFDDGQIATIKMALAFTAHRRDASGNPVDFATFYENIRKRLYNIVIRLFPRSKKHVTLYSARHQLIADLKATGYSLPEIACIVGHGNDVTASEHYGKKRVGRSRMNLPSANPADLDKIRRLYKSFLPSKEKIMQKKPT